jgi:hypothetical protein
VPKLSRVAVLVNAGFPPALATLKAMEAPARTLGVTVVRFDAREPGDLEGVFAAVTRARSDALVVTGGPAQFNMRTQIARLALRHRLPSISAITEDVEAGGLMSYGASLSDQWRRAATYVDKILKGAQPGDLPVEQPTKFELVINLKTAKALRPHHSADASPSGRPPDRVNECPTNAASSCVLLSASPGFLAPLMTRLSGHSARGSTPNPPPRRNGLALSFAQRKLSDGLKITRRETSNVLV